MSCPHIQCQLEAEKDTGLAYLPYMETDITIWSADGTTILDAKYYNEAMSGRNSTEKIRSGHLPQLFSCLMNQRTDEPLTHHIRCMLRDSV